MNESKEFLWVEKYRPIIINECILPKSMKTMFTDMVKNGNLQNLLLSGGAGCGKTTIAKALCNELDAEYIMINCSEDGNIDTLRTRIRNFASTVSMSGQKKVVILDEFSENCRFILTCNFKNRIIEPLHSRCTVIEFKIPNKEKPSLATELLGRLSRVLNSEGVSFEEPVLAELINKHFPDFRRIINELQRYSVAGTIDVGILTQIGEIHIKDLISFMKSKDFSSVRKWAVSNIDNSPSELFRKIYDNLYEYMESSSIPQAILILGEYQYKSAFVADLEINLVACLVELMMECEFK